MNINKNLDNANNSSDDKENENGLENDFPCKDKKLNEKEMKMSSENNEKDNFFSNDFQIDNASNYTSSVEIDYTVPAEFDHCDVFNFYDYQTEELSNDSSTIDDIFYTEEIELSDIDTDTQSEIYKNEQINTNDKFYDLDDTNEINEKDKKLINDLDFIPQDVTYTREFPDEDNKIKNLHKQEKNLDDRMVKFDNFYFYHSKDNIFTIPTKEFENFINQQIEDIDMPLEIDYWHIANIIALLHGKQSTCIDKLMECVINNSCISYIFEDTSNNVFPMIFNFKIYDIPEESKYLYVYSYKNTTTDTPVDHDQILDLTNSWNTRFFTPSVYCKSISKFNYSIESKYYIDLTKGCTISQLFTWIESAINTSIDAQKEINSSYMEF